MSITNVGRLFSEIDVRDDLRKGLNRCKNKSDFFSCLEINHIDFTFEEFEEAINLMHVKCQTQDAANELFGKVNWFRFLFYSLEN